MTGVILKDAIFSDHTKIGDSHYEIVGCYITTHENVQWAMRQLDKRWKRQRRWERFKARFRKWYGWISRDALDRVLHDSKEETK